MGAPSALQATTVTSFVTLASCRALALDRAGVTGSQPGDASPSTLGASSCDYSAKVKKQLLPLWIVLGIVGAGVLIWLMCWCCRQAILAYFRIKHNKRMNESVRTTHWGCANNACVACLVEARQAEEGMYSLRDWARSTLPRTRARASLSQINFTPGTKWVTKNGETAWVIRGMS